MLLHSLLAIVSISAGTALADEPAHTQSLWRSDPLSAFVLSEEPVEDRNGDGKPDLWRVFDQETGKLKILKFDTTYARGKPNLWYYYDENGRMVRSEEDTKLTGKPDMVTTYGQDSEGRVQLKLLSERKADGKFGREEVITTLSPLVRRHEVHSGKSTWTFEEDPMSSSDNKADAADSSTCRFNQVPPGGFDEAKIRELTDKLGSNVEVASNCSGRPAGMAEGVKEGPPITPSDITRVLRSGIQCLTQKGGSSLKLRDQLLANALATGRKLKIDCEIKTAACVSGGEMCGQTSHFGEPDFPQISLNRNCMISTKGDVLASERDRTIFHEMLHLTGQCGHQHLHNYQIASKSEIVEPCAQCCMAEPGHARDLNCDICNGKVNSPIEKNALTSAEALLALKNPAAALVEARKAAILAPNNMEAWAKVAIALKQQQETRMDPFFDNADDHTRYLFLTACEQFRSLAMAWVKSGKPFKDMPGAEFATSSMVGTYCAKGESGARIAENIETKQKAKVESQLGSPTTDAVFNSGQQFMKQRALLRNVLANCGPMSAATGTTDEEKAARYCYDLASTYSKGMNAAVEASKIASSNNEKVWKPLEQESKRMSDGLGCSVGTPAKTLAECFPPKATAKAAAPGCPVPPGI